MRYAGIVLAMLVIGGCGIGQEVYQRGSHPTVARASYSVNPHKFECKNDPYSCKECPVGKPDRVIKIGHGPYKELNESDRGVPPSINVWFLCEDINMLVPPPGAEDSDSFICQREPADGYVEYEGKKYSCAASGDTDQKVHLGTIQAGETKTMTIKIPLQ